MLPLSHSLSTASCREEEFRKYLFSQITWPPKSKSCKTCHLTNALHVSALSLPLQAHQSLSALFHTCIGVCRFPSTVDYVIAGSSKWLNWLGTFNCRVQTEEVTSPLSSGLVSWKSSQGWGFSNPWACSHPWQNILHSPAPRNFGVPWPLANLWQSIKKKKWYNQQSPQNCVGSLRKQATLIKSLLCARMLKEFLVLGRSKIIIITWIRYGFQL